MENEGEDKLLNALSNLKNQISSGSVIGPEEEAQIIATGDGIPKPDVLVDITNADLEEVPPEEDEFDGDESLGLETEGEVESEVKGETSTSLVVKGEEPAYMREEFPKNMSDQVKWYLLRNEATPEDLVANGFTAGTVRNAISFLKKEGLWKQVALAKREQQLPEKRSASKVFAKGSPPEAMIDNIQMPEQVGSMPQFEMGMKTGMSLLVTAVRIVQELGAIGLQQAQPLIKMASEMRAGEVAAAKSAASDAAAMATDDMTEKLGPVLNQILQQGTPLVAPPKTRDEAGARVQEKMSRMMDPLIDRLINRAIPGAAGNQELPSGWTTESK